MGKNMTLKDIAAQLNLSIATVDRAVNDRDDICQETKDLVLNKLKEVGYRPNKIARRLVSKKDYKVGVVLFDDPNYFWSEMERGIRRAEDQFSDFGVQSLYYRIGYEISEQKYALEQLAQENINAIIIKPWNDELIIDVLKEQVENGVRVVTVNDDLKDVGRMFYVGPQDIESGKTAGELIGVVARNGI